MGANDRQFEQKRNKRVEAKERRGRRAGAAGEVDWASFNWWAVIAATEALLEHGGALRLGKTRDGGAWAIGVYLGDDYATEYVRPSEDFRDAVREIVAAWLPDEVGKYDERLAQLEQ